MTFKFYILCVDITCWWVSLVTLALYLGVFIPPHVFLKLPPIYWGCLWYIGEWGGLESEGWGKKGRVGRWPCRWVRCAPEPRSLQNLSKCFTWNTWLKEVSRIGHLLRTRSCLKLVLNWDRFPLNMCSSSFLNWIPNFQISHHSCCFSSICQ